VSRARWTVSGPPSYALTSTSVAAKPVGFVGRDAVGAWFGTARGAVAPLVAMSGWVVIGVLPL